MAGAQSTLIDIRSNYDGSAVKTATTDVKNFGAEMDNTSNKAEGLLRRLERPIGFLAFSGLADQITDVGAKGQSAGMMLEKAFHVAGLTLTYFNPVVGFSVIAITALYEAIRKFTDAPTAETVQKNLEAFDKQKQAFAESADQLLKMNLINKQSAEALKNLAGAENEKIEKQKQDLKTLVDAREAELNATKARVEGNRFLKDTARGLQEVQEAQEKYTKVLTAFTAVSEYQKKLDAQKPDNAQIEFLQKIAEAREKLTARTLTAAQLKAQVVAREVELDKLLLESSKATTDGQMKNIERRISAIQSLQAIDNEALTKKQENANKENQIYKTQANEVDKYQKQISNIFTASHGQVVAELGKYADDVIKQTADMLAQQLTLQAMKDLANPFTVPIGIAELAAATAISAAGGAAGAAVNAALTPDTSSSSTTGNNSVAAGASNGANGTPTTRLTINVMGDVLGDDAYLTRLATALNKTILNNNVQLSATQIVVGGATSQPAPTAG